MPDTQVYIRRSDDDGLDLVCGTCGEHVPLLLREPIFQQVRCFLDKHQHDER